MRFSCLPYFKLNRFRRSVIRCASGREGGMSRLFVGGLNAGTIISIATVPILAPLGG